MIRSDHGGHDCVVVNALDELETELSSTMDESDVEHKRYLQFLGEVINRRIPHRNLLQFDVRVTFYRELLPDESEGVVDLLPRTCKSNAFVNQLRY